MRTSPALERFLHAAEQADRLDAPGYQLEHALKLGFLLLGRRSRAFQDLLHGVWLGHPLHPALVTVPIGSWSAALLLDLLDATGRGGPGAGQAADLAMGLGAAGAVAAATAGLTDWQHSHDEARRVGVVHATLNTAALGLYAWSLVDRAGDRPGRARMTALAGYAITTTSSWLGGALSYRHRLGADHCDPRMGPRRYTPAANLADLPEGKPYGVEVDGVPVVLLREGNLVYAVGGSCPHLGAPLAQGWTHRGALVCPWHGSRFDPVTGEVMQGPATHPLPCFDVRMEGESVQLRRRAPRRSPTALTTRKEASR